MKKVLIPTKLDTVAAKTLEANGNYTVIQDTKTPLEALVAANPDAYALIVSEPVQPDNRPVAQLKVIVRGVRRATRQTMPQARWT